MASTNEPKSILRNKYSSESSGRRTTRKKLELEMNQTGSTTTTTEKGRVFNRASFAKKKDDDASSPGKSQSDTRQSGPDSGSNKDCLKLYTSVANDDNQNQDASMVSNLADSSRPGSPAKHQSEVGGTGTEDEQPPRSKNFHISVADLNNDMRYCEKVGCRLRAFGKCGWDNPCKIPRSKGGCGSYYCEFHGSQFDNFRKFQCCSDCYTMFMQGRKARYRARIILMIAVAVLLIVSMILIGVFSAKSDDLVDMEHQAREKEIREIFEGKREMTLQISLYWGQKANEFTNRVRAEQSLKPLEWSNQMHTVAYQRCREVAKDIIKFKQSNLLNVISQTRSFYEPDYEVGSLSEQSWKLINVKSGQDYIAEWADSWTVDHYFEAGGDFSHEATALYFDGKTNTVIFTELFAMISEIPTHSK